MGMEMEWCCVHLARGNGSLYAISSLREDSRAAEDREDVEDIEDNANAASVFELFEHS